MTDECSSSASGGLHAYLDLSRPYFCVFCHEENAALKESWTAARERQIVIEARAHYQQNISAIALQLLQQFMSANMIRDFGQVIRESSAVKAPVGLTEMLDMSLAGAIHFVNELSKLQPNEKYVAQYAKHFDARQQAYAPPSPIMSP